MTDKELYYCITDKESGDYLDGPFDTLREALDVFWMNYDNDTEGYDIELVEYDEVKE